jgi:hypothetical protein
LLAFNLDRQTLMQAGRWTAAGLNKRLRATRNKKNDMPAMAQLARLQGRGR